MGLPSRIGTTSESLQTSKPPIVAALAVTGPSLALTAQSAIRVSDTGASVRSWTLGGEEHSAVSRDGGVTWLSLPDPDYRLNWRKRSFDPQLGDPGVLA